MIIYLSLILWFSWVVFLVWAHLADFCSQLVAQLREMEWLDSWILPPTFLLSFRILAWTCLHGGRNILNNDRVSATHKHFSFVILPLSREVTQASKIQYGKVFSKNMYLETEVLAINLQTIPQQTCLTQVSFQ